MINKQIKGYQCVFFLLSILNVIAKLYLGFDYLVYAIYVYIVILKVTKKMDAEEFLLYSIFIPQKYLQMLSMMLYLVFSNGLFKRKVEKKHFLFICFIAASALFNCISYGGLIFASVFQIVYYYSIFWLSKELNRNLDIEKIIRHLDFIFVLEILVAVIDWIATKKTGDFIQGTFESAHYFGVFILAYIFLLFKTDDYHKGNLNVTVRLILAVICFYILDAKHVFAVFIFALIFVRLLSILKVKKQLVATSVFVLLAVVAFISIINNISLFNESGLATYVFNSDYNLKYRYILKTLNEMWSLNGLVGFGPGQFGSQISLSLSKGLAYPWESSLSSYRYAIEPYSRVLSGLFTKWYVDYGIVQSSMVLGYPLVSFVGMFAELGVIGYFWFFYILDDIFVGKNNTFLIMFVLLTFFDTYFEIVCVVVMILIASAFSQYKGKIKIGYSQNCSEEIG